MRVISLRERLTMQCVKVDAVKMIYSLSSVVTASWTSCIEMIGMRFSKVRMRAGDERRPDDPVCADMNVSLQSFAKSFNSFSSGVSERASFLPSTKVRSSVNVVGVVESIMEKGLQQQ